MEKKVITGLNYTRPLTISDYVSIKDAIERILTNGLDVGKWRNASLTAMGKVPSSNEPSLQEVQSIVASFKKTIEVSNYIQLYATLINLLQFTYDGFPVNDIVTNLYLPEPIYEDTKDNSESATTDEPSSDTTDSEENPLVYE